MLRSQLEDVLLTQTRVRRSQPLEGAPSDSELRVRGAGRLVISESRKGGGRGFAEVANEVKQFTGHSISGFTFKASQISL